MLPRALRRGRKLRGPRAGVARHPRRRPPGRPAGRGEGHARRLLPLGVRRPHPAPHVRRCRHGVAAGGARLRPGNGAPLAGTHGAPGGSAERGSPPGGVGLERAASATGRGRRVSPHGHLQPNPPLGVLVARQRALRSPRGQAGGRADRHRGQPGGSDRGPDHMAGRDAHSGADDAGRYGGLEPPLPPPPPSTSPCPESASGGREGRRSRREGGLRAAPHSRGPVPAGPRAPRRPLRVHRGAARLRFRGLRGRRLHERRRPHVVLCALPHRGRPADARPAKKSRPPIARASGPRGHPRDPARGHGPGQRGGAFLPAPLADRGHAGEPGRAAQLAVPVGLRALLHPASPGAEAPDQGHRRRRLRPVGDRRGERRHDGRPVPRIGRIHARRACPGGRIGRPRAHPGAPLRSRLPGGAQTEPPQGRGDGRRRGRRRRHHTPGRHRHRRRGGAHRTGPARGSAPPRRPFRRSSPIPCSSSPRTCALATCRGSARS